jgi:excisionase family DNA binding protein
MTTRFVTVAEVAADTGIATRTVYDLLKPDHPRRLPAVQLSGTNSPWLIPRQAYERWLASLETEAHGATPVTSIDDRRRAAG